MSEAVTLWQQVVAGGVSFILFLGLLLFFRGDLVNGGVARQARIDQVEELKKAHAEQVALLQQHNAEIQEAWQRRVAEAVEERNYYRNLALTSTRHTGEAIALASDKLPRL